jgi:hypothetical protein
MTVSVAQRYEPSGRMITWSWSGATDPAANFIVDHAAQDARAWSWLLTSCRATQPSTVRASGTCSLLNPGLPPHSHVVITLHPASYLATSAPFQLSGAL